MYSVLIIKFRSQNSFITLEINLLAWFPHFAGILQSARGSQEITANC